MNTNAMWKLVALAWILGFFLSIDRFGFMVEGVVIGITFLCWRYGSYLFMGSSSILTAW